MTVDKRLKIRLDDDVRELLKAKANKQMGQMNPIANHILREALKNV